MSLHLRCGVASEQLDREARKQGEEDSHKWWLESCETVCAISGEASLTDNKEFNWDSCYSKCLADEP